jgi:hypothetical protein
VIEESDELIDKRVNKLKPFQIVTPADKRCDFEPTFELRDENKFVQLSAEYIKKFINAIERAFPDKENIIMVGGKDSQLILLVPKVSSRWSVFSSDPNYKIVQQFVLKNDIKVNKIYGHPDECNETKEDFKRKLLASDISVDPRHMRWRPKLGKIVEEHDRNCIFWAGQLGDTIYSYHNYYQRKDRKTYFQTHFNKAANQMGADHASIKNQFGVPMLSPYHSEGIWSDVYSKFDPKIIDSQTDLRNDLGRNLYGGGIWWPKKNPTPKIYKQDFCVDPVGYYLDHIKQNL